MNEFAGRVVAILILAAVVAFIAILVVKHSANQPRLPLVNASAPCELKNPCEYMDCRVREGPFGGVDPDAGERDNRRIA